MALQIEAFYSEDAFTQLREAWHVLLQQSQRNHIFMTWEWQSHWWTAYHPGDLWIITVRDEQNQLVGLFPWFIHDHPKGRMVRSVGCVEVTDYIEPIVKAGLEADVYAAVAAYALSEKQRYDMLDFCNLPEESPVLKLFPPALEAVGFTIKIKQQEVCPVIKLPDTWDSYLENLDKKQRHELRRKLRRASAPDHKVEWYMVSHEDDLQDAMQRFLTLMRASSPDKAKFLDDPENVAFFNRVVPVIAECGWLALSFLTIDGKDAASYLSFDYGNHIQLYNSGHDPATFAELSPGVVLLAYIIEDAINKKRDVFDFLRGNEEYKYRMGGVDTPIMMLNATP